MFETVLPTLPLIPLYAEIHYRFRFFPISLYFRKMPEIIFDCPWRIRAERPVTFFLLLKDAHRWPLTLKSVSVQWQAETGESGEATFPLNQEVSTPWFHQEFALDEVELPRTAHISLVPKLHFLIRNRKKTVVIDNFSGLSKKPLQTYLADEDFPELPGWRTGDIHVHTELTADQVEFGAPLEMTQHGAEVMGLDFVAATDHSYDLDDKPDDYLHNDPQLTKWYTSRRSMLELNGVNSAEKSVFIPGEEITVRNVRQQNIHLLHLNDSQFFPGSGDGAERWLKTKSEYKVSHVLENRSQGTVSIAAHLNYKVPFLHRLLIDRDEWQFNDLLTPGLNGAQVISGTPESRDFTKSRILWIRALLQGLRLAIYGGSDAHGNFNVFRQVKMPMIMLFRLNDQILGQARTLIDSTGNEPEKLISAMQQRRTAASTGPVGDLQLITPDGMTHRIGEDVEILSEYVTIRLEGLSTAEFGVISDILLYQGNLTARQEAVIWEKVPAKKTFRVNHTLKFRISEPTYFRLEIKTPGNNRWPGVYLSTPIWVRLPQR
ncbi:MAG: hypothetical protein K9N11_06700 [Lentisphaeria bacterium]|nr:hypothetical protein [Candidatus Neomarinimicrobiota bacterium]MCF7842524.1 hypothetical protein [Lentisphaeria bacterium]